MTHLLRDIRHRQIFFARKVGQEEELGERHVAFIEFVGQVQDAAALREQDEVSEAIGIGMQRGAGGA